MPRREPPLPESRANSPANRVPKKGHAGQTPMDKFNDLARRVVNVPREELRREQERYDAANAARRVQRKRKTVP